MKFCHLVMLFCVVVLIQADDETKKQENILKKDALVDAKQLSTGNEGQSSTLKDTVESLLRGMELSSVKRSVDNLLAKETVDLSGFVKPKKINKKNDWLKKGIKPADWLKKEISKKNSLKKGVVVPNLLNEKINKKEVKPSLTEDLKVADWLKQAEDKREAKKDAEIHDRLRQEVKKKEVSSFPEFLKIPMKEATNIVDDQNANNRVLKELSAKSIYKTFDMSEKKTVDRFISALKVISDEETNMKLKKQLGKSSKKEVDLYAVDDKGKCEDEEPDCERYKNYCDSFKEQMRRHCAKTCGFCKSGCDPDIAGSEQCKKIKEVGFCKQPTSQLLCASTCLCQSCDNSIYGCCWDKKTMKNDKEGTNCLTCKDKYDVSVCSMFKNDCKSKNEISKKWMLANCMNTCGLCSIGEKDNNSPNPNSLITNTQHTCEDEDQQSEFCPIWKNAGWCEEKEEIMEKFCMKTCFNCNMVI